MTVWIANRLMQAFGVVLVMTLIVFLAVNVIGDPIEMLISPEADQMERQRIIALFGLDQPLWRQYLAFLKGAVQGDLGRSFVYGEPALKVIFQRLPATLELAVSASLISVAVGLPLGLIAGLYPRRGFSKAIMATSILGFSLPSFWVGLLLIMVFAVYLGWLPSSGRGETVEVLGMHLSFLTLDGLRHLALPAINLAIFNTAVILRLTRAGVSEVMPQEYIRFARAKGVSERRVIGIHVLKNIMIPVVTVIGLEFGALIAFSVITESIFAWPGIGKLIIDSINVLDRPMMVAYLMLVVTLFVTVNLVIDILYMLLDPRVSADGKD